MQSILVASQKNMFDNTTPDTRLHQCLQAFRVIKIVAAMTRTNSVPCAIMPAMSTTCASALNSDPNKFVPFVLGLMSCYEFYRGGASERRRIIILILICPRRPLCSSCSSW
jgi:hypothetical protein